MASFPVHFSIPATPVDCGNHYKIICTFATFVFRQSCLSFSASFSDTFYDGQGIESDLHPQSELTAVFRLYSVSLADFFLTEAPRWHL